jgi:glycosyltransferase involved in cell wall biosynthesis
MQEPRAVRAHVLTITDTIGRGGAEEIALTLNLGLDPQRFRRSFCLTRDPTPMDPTGRFDAPARLERLRADGVELLLLERHSTLNLLAWLRLARFMRAQHVDIVHSHKFGSNFWGTVVAKLARVPVILAHEHTWSFEGERLRRFIDRRVISRLADAVIAVSDADRRRMHDIVGIPAQRIVLIPNGIEPLPPGDGPALRREVGVPGDAPVLVAVANLRPQKAFDVMLRAVALLRPRFPNVYLLIAGGGRHGTELEALAAELGISSAVVFLGVRRDIENVLAAGHVAVSSSDFEGSPLAAMQYLAAALPVVATDVGGMPDLVRHGENGLLVPRRNPEALAGALGELLADPDRARLMGERGRELQREQFSLDAMVQRVQDLYLERLEAARLGARTPRSPQARRRRLKGAKRL